MKTNTLLVCISLAVSMACSDRKDPVKADAEIAGFPVGYYEFSKDKAFNFQLNRWHSMGYARYEDMVSVGSKISSFGEWKTEMVNLAEQAVSENRLMNASCYYRAAEFFTTRDDPNKERFYNSFIDYFYQAVEDQNLETVHIPYNENAIQALVLRPDSTKKKGTIVLHGGFDSFKEELYSLMAYFQSRDYEVINFETPWMGTSRKNKETGLDIEWEKLVGAVLDHFELDDVTLIGISMGGWLSLRAAAFEPRVKRVIASSVSYDVNQYNNAIGRKLSAWLMREKRDFVNENMIKKMEKDLYYAWFVNHLMYVTNKETPIEAFDVLTTFSAENLHSDQVKQDVLILTGRKDHMVPYKMHAMQVEALTNARSVTARVFTKEETAQNHCQIGNLGLALTTMLDWIESK